MIAARELRIGNKVKEDKYPTLISEIEQLHSEYVIARYSDSISYENIEPIPITSELLEKCGFIPAGEMAGSEWYECVVFIESRPQAVCYNFSLFACQDDEFGCNLEEQYLGTIKYLHQLQNIYYVLTNKELNIII